MTLSTQPYIVSVDDHVIEPPHLWQSRLPAKLRDRGPKVVETDEGLAWELDGDRHLIYLVTATAGMPYEDRLFRGIRSYEELRPGAYDPVERVKDMDVDGVIASLCFASYVGFGGTRFNTLDDRELAFACLRAYNDFQLDEWAGAAPGRLYGMILLPYWDPQEAVSEVQRGAAKGARAIAFSENPSRQGFPSIHDRDRYWDPVFAAAQEAGLPLCIHFGSSSWVLTTSDDAPMIVSSVASPCNSQLAFVDWMFSGALERFPELQIVFSESYLGWLPFMMEHCDRHWSNHFAWASDHKTIPHPPSEYFARQVSACLVYDPFGAENIERIGAGRVLAEADYPHPDSQWPNTAKILEELLAHLSPEDRTRVLRTNAEELFRLDLPAF
jgi:predicted TIM-barrel fold metal-dependent hydrolase